MTQANLPDDDYADEPLRGEPLVGTTAEERQWGMFCHLSALLGMLVGGMAFLGPLVCWLIKKDTSKFVDRQGKEALNFQINMLIYLLISIAIAIATCGVGAVLSIALGIYGIVMPIIAGLEANKGKDYRYPYTFRLFNMD